MIKISVTKKEFQIIINNLLTVSCFLRANIDDVPKNEQRECLARAAEIQQLAEELQQKAARE